MLSRIAPLALVLLLTFAAVPGSAMSIRMKAFQEGDAEPGTWMNLTQMGEMGDPDGDGVVSWVLDPDPEQVENDPELGDIFRFEIGGTELGAFLLGGGETGIMGWEADLKVDPFVTNNINITNTTAFNVTYIASVVLPIPAFDYTKVVFSSFGITATDSDGDNSLLVSEDGGLAFYRGRVEHPDLSIDTLLALTLPTLTTADCTPTASQPGCTATYVDGVASLDVPDDTATELELILRFTLSPGDSVGITSRFEIVPEPATGLLVALGVTALAIARRPRR